MLYRVGTKFYIRVQGYYKEVDVSIEGDNLEVKPNGNEIEISSVKNVISYNVNSQLNEIKEVVSKEKRHEEKPREQRHSEEIEYKPRRNRENRM